MQAGEAETVMKATFRIHFEGEEQAKELVLREKEDLATIINFDRICKKILQAYMYKLEGKNLITLSISNFYRGSRLAIPIHNPLNYTYLVADMIARRQESTVIDIHVARNGELTKRRKREKAVPIEFDSDGEVEEAENEAACNFIKANIPNEDQRYRSKAAVRCCFCHKSSRDSEECRIAGHFYGPFKNNSYAHLMCLLWCSSVFVDEEDELRLKGVDKAIANSRNLKCKYCGQKGASTYCHAKRCKRAGHYACSMNNNWHFDWVIYKNYCPDCAASEETAIEESRTKTISQRPERAPAMKMEEEEHKE